MCGTQRAATCSGSSVPTGNIQALLTHLHGVLHDRIAADRTRLLHVEARLRAFEQAQTPQPDEALQSVIYLLEHQYELPRQNLSLRYPDHVYEFSDTQQTRWALFLPGRAALLQYLETCDYPAPRVVCTRTGETLAFHGPWCALVTRERGMPRATPTHAHMQALGDALGRLPRLESTTRGAPQSQAGSILLTPSKKRSTTPTLLAQRFCPLYSFQAAPAFKLNRTIFQA